MKYTTTPDRDVGSSDSSASGLFEVGETLKCLQYVERRDRRASINAGDLVKVIQAFAFTHEGKQCQDITVQRGHDMPIAVLVAPGRFARVSSPNVGDVARQAAQNTTLP